MLDCVTDGFWYFFEKKKGKHIKRRCYEKRPQLRRDILFHSIRNIDFIISSDLLLSSLLLSSSWLCRRRRGYVVVDVDGCRYGLF